MLGGHAAACIIIKTRELHLEAAAEREEGTDTRGGQGTIYAGTYALKALGGIAEHW